MKTPFFIVVIFFALFLTSCGQNNDNHNTTPTEKQIFTIKTTTLSDFKTDISTEKTAIIQANSTLTIPAETSGKISKIFVKEWQKLKAGETIATIEDTFNNYDLALLQAKNRIATEQAGNETQLVNLENSVISAKMNYDKALLAYNQLISQNNLKYDNLVKKNADTKASYHDTYINNLNAMEAMMSQYLNEADQTLGMTDNYRYNNDVFERYLGANGGGTIQAEESWNVLYAARGAVRARVSEKKIFGEWDVDADFAVLDSGYNALRKLADEMLLMHQNNLVGNTISIAQNTAWNQQWSWLRQSLAGNETNYISWKNQTKNFLENYKNEELATKYANSDEIISAAELKELQENKDLKLAYDNADLATKQAIDNAKLSLEQAKTAWENAEKIKNSTQRQQSINLGNSEIALRQAERNASKLTIKAPINGIVTKISAEVGQSINNGTVIIEFVGQEAEAIVEIDPRMALFLENGQEVTATIGEEKIVGKITAISSVANKNLLSSVRISFANADNFIGQTANISLNLPNNITPTFLLPLNSVKIIAEGQGEIKIFENGEIRSESVRLGTMYGSAIEIFTELDENTTIILSDVSAYNSEKQELKVE